MKLIRTSINITQEQKEWLKKHPEYVVGPLVRKIINELMEKDGEILA